MKGGRGEKEREKRKDRIPFTKMLDPPLFFV